MQFGFACEPPLMFTGMLTDAAFSAMLFKHVLTGKRPENKPVSPYEKHSAGLCKRYAGNSYFGKI
jgi:hypothetical protein